MNVQMPGMNGLEATRHVVDDPAIASRVIILTTFEHDEYVFEALRAGASRRRGRLDALPICHPPRHGGLRSPSRSFVARDRARTTHRSWERSRPISRTCSQSWDYAIGCKQSCLRPRTASSKPAKAEGRGRVDFAS
ncbi:MAG: hypothetical protein ABI658_17575 [Acidimicrobiales bacterium]